MGCLKFPPVLNVNFFFSNFHIFVFVFRQGKSLVTTSMKVISLVGDAVLTIRVPDEQMIPTELTMTLGTLSKSLRLALIRLPEVNFPK